MSAAVETRWGYSAPPPTAFGRERQQSCQRRIDGIVGTTDNRPRIKLEWGPEALTWMPHRLSDDAVGYTFPQFYDKRDEFGNYLAVERWVLLQRVEWEHFGPSWEAIRYKKHDGSIWDLKGPCPSEKYIALKCHLYHDTICCPCRGEECNCEATCWGKYVEPDDGLMDWIRRVSWEAQHDPDVDPFADGRFFEAPHAQQELKSRQTTAAEASREPTAFDREALDLFMRAPRSVNLKLKEAKKELPAGFRKSKKSGLYLLN